MNFGQYTCWVGDLKLESGPICLLVGDLKRESGPTYLLDFLSPFTYIPLIVAAPTVSNIVLNFTISEVLHVMHNSLPMRCFREDNSRWITIRNKVFRAKFQGKLMFFSEHFSDVSFVLNLLRVFVICTSKIPKSLLSFINQNSPLTIRATVLYY